MATYSDFVSSKRTLQASYPLNFDRYNPTQEEKSFFKSLTRIEDDEDLKQHILTVQAKAYELFPYPSISSFLFMKQVVTELPGYSDLMLFAHNNRDALLLDVGCGFGHDTRKIVLDGFPANNIIASDIHGEFWSLGHELFRSTPDTFPARFMEGDILNPQFLEQRPVVYPGDVNETLPQPLSEITSLTPLHGKLSAITALALFHVFDEEQQMRVAKRLASLLSSRPGSMILGWQVGSAVPKLESGDGPRPPIFFHSPASWTEMWDGQVFSKGTVRVDVELRRRPGQGTGLDGIYWCITRL